jgi:glucose/arabinose dehydrogenase
MSAWRCLCVLGIFVASVGCGSDDDGLEPPQDGAAQDGGPDGGGDGQVPASSLRFERIELELEEMTEAGHQQVTTFRFIPGTNELLLSELHGDVYHYEVADGVGTLLGHFDLSEHVYPPAPDFEGDCGLVSLAFDPGFADNGYFYVGACFDELGTGILRFTFEPDDYDDITGSAAVIMREEWEGDIHNVGQMGFDQDGYLWALYGDRGNPDHGLESSSNLASLVRVEPNREPDGEGHGPAPGNPYIGGEGGSEDIYAYGFRSPWTGHYDSLGRWWVGDVGSGGTFAAEEINLVTEPGSYFGWPVVEGPCESMCGDIVDPIRSWDHSSGHPFVAEMASPFPSQNRVAWVGVEYRDRGNDPYGGLLTGGVLYGEMCVGFVRLIEVDATGEVLSDALVAEFPKISAWDQAADGYLYVTTYGACEARRNVPDVPAGLWRAVRGEPS